MMSFDGRIAIVTGAGRGLGRSYALGLAARGAKVVVADLGENADEVVAELEAAGGVGRARRLDVTSYENVDQVVQEALRDWGRVDILINNAGILRDKSFAKMDLDDFRAVIDVHLMGSVNCCKAVWEIMRQQNYGRILLTSSSSGLYGNFGQSNYGAAKAAMLGLMNVLHLEGEKYGIKVNALLPTAATHMTEGLLDPADVEMLAPEAIVPGVLYLVAGEAPSRVMLSAGAGSFARTIVRETVGVFLPEEQRTPEAIAGLLDRISDPAGAVELFGAFEQTEKLVALARRARSGGSS